MVFKVPNITHFTHTLHTHTHTKVKNNNTVIQNNELKYNALETATKLVRLKLKGAKTTRRKGVSLLHPRGDHHPRLNGVYNTRSNDRNRCGPRAIVGLYECG